MTGKKEKKKKKKAGKIIGHPHRFKKKPIVEPECGRIYFTVECVAYLRKCAPRVDFYFGVTMEDAFKKKKENKEEQAHHLGIRE